MTHRNGTLAAFLLTAGMISLAAQANTVVLYQGSYSFSDGGEFTAVTAPSQALGPYSSYTSTATSFQTFCVQVGTEFAPGNTYDYTLSLTSLGGPGYPGSPVAVGSPYSYPLAVGTAWLYAQFAEGTLGGYDFSNSSGQRQADAGALQAAIWALQGGQTNPGAGYSSGTVGNTYYDEAVAALGLGNVDNAATLNDNYGVEIMNLTSGGAQNDYQNQLVLLPVGNILTAPDSSTSLGLLSIALAGLGLFSRKLAVAKTR